MNGTVRKSPARAEPAEERAWFPVPDVDALPPLEDVRQLSTPGKTVYASPARAVPAEPEAWLPIPDVDSLPALEELLDDDRLVRSGQTEAITDTQPTPVVPPEERWAAFRARVPQRRRTPPRRRSRRIDLRQGRTPAAKPAPAPAPKPALKPRTKRARP